MTTQASTRSRGKRHDDAIKQREHLHPYPPEEAIKILKEMAPAKFDETVELHIKTNADPRHADQLIRSVTQLPHGTGKSQRVVAFVQGEAESIAREAGADFIGDADLIRKIEQEGWVDFEVSIATPEMMGTDRTPRPCTRPARADAQPPHRHCRTAAGHSASHT